MSSDPLAPLVRRLFEDLAHAGVTSDLPALQGEAGRADRGTRVRFVLRHEAGRISSARFLTYGCPHTLAACEWLCRELEAGRRESLGAPTDWCRALGVPIHKLGRLLIIEDALRAALQQMKT